MVRIAYRDFIAGTPLDTIEEFLIYHNGFYLKCSKNKGYWKIIINDEILDEPFTEKIISYISLRFKILDSKIVNTWNKEKTPFHSNDLIFDLDGNIPLNDIVRFVFEDIYKIYEN